MLPFHCTWTELRHTDLLSVLILPLNGKSDILSSGGRKFWDAVPTFWVSYIWIIQATAVLFSQNLSFLSWLEMWWCLQIIWFSQVLLTFLFSSFWQQQNKWRFFNNFVPGWLNGLEGWWHCDRGRASRRGLSLSSLGSMAGREVLGRHAKACWLRSSLSLQIRSRERWGWKKDGGGRVTWHGDVVERQGLEPRSCAQAVRGARLLASSEGGMPRQSLGRESWRGCQACRRSRESHGQEQGSHAWLRRQAGLLVRSSRGTPRQSPREVSWRGCRAHQQRMGRTRSMAGAGCIHQIRYPTEKCGEESHRVLPNKVGYSRPRAREMAEPGHNAISGIEP